MRDVTITLTDARHAALTSAYGSATTAVQRFADHEADASIFAAEAREFERIGIPTNIRVILDADQAAFVITDATAKKAAKDAAIAAAIAAEQLAAAAAAAENP